MKRQIFGWILVGMLVGVTLPVSCSASLPMDTDSVEKYSDCYIEISGCLSEKDYPSIVGISMWKLVFLRPQGNDNPAAFVLYWFLRFKETAEITIYDQKNGNILWQHNGVGEQQLRIVWFDGEYQTTLIPGVGYQKDICGIVKVMWVKPL